MDSEPNGGALVQPRQHFSGYSWEPPQALGGNAGGTVDGILAVFHSSWGKAPPHDSFPDEALKTNQIRQTKRSQEG